MSDSLQTPTNSSPAMGVTKLKVAPIPPDKYTSTRPKTVQVSTAFTAKSPPAIPTGTGARIPIPINGAGANANTQMLDNMPSAMRASIPNVMADEFPEAEIPESLEDAVQRLRPKTLRLQWRFVYTLFFALWLFGRLIFWQVYAAKFFPKWVKKNNHRRWRKYARQFREFATEMGGVQIKAGQFASTRADIMPEEVIAELAGLQDQVPTIPYEQILAVLNAEFSDLMQRFKVIQQEPVAAASLGQVHRAQLQTGERVVIKVQRPEVREIVYTDMAALFIVGHVANRFDFIRRRMDTVLIIEEFGRVLLEEIDYHKEADNARRFAKNFANDAGVYVPSVYQQHSTEKVLTLEDVTAIKIDDYERLAAAGIDRKQVAKRLMDTYMQQIFDDRFFHADPHPGNLFVYPLPVANEADYQQNGARPFYLIFIDFGMTATLSPEIVQGLVNTMVAVITRDARKLIHSYQELGFLMPDADTERMVEATEAVFNQVWGMSISDMANMDFAVVENIGKEFSDLLSKMPFRVPQDFVYLGRTVSILSGMATKLDPTFNPWDDIQRHVAYLVTSDTDNNVFDEFGKIIQEAVNEILTDGPQGFVRVAERLVDRLQRMNRSEQMLQRLIDGDVAIATKLSPQHRYQLERIELQGRRTARMVIVGSLVISSTLFYTNGDSVLASFALGVGIITYLSTWFIRE